MMMGCVSGTVPIRINAPSEAMKRCEDLPKAEDGRLPTLILNHVEVRGYYEECSTRHNILIDRIKEINQRAGE